MNTREARAVRNLLLAALGERPAADTTADAEYLAGSLHVLSERQQQVLELLAEGLTEAAIGRRLNMAAATVKAHKVALFRHLEARSTAHAVAIAFRRGLIR